MRPDIQQQITPTPLPMAPPERHATRRRQRFLRTAVAIFATWFVLGGALIQQRFEIDRWRRASDASAGASEVRLASLSASQGRVEGRLNGLFDPESVVVSALPSVFTLIAGRVQGSAFVLSSDADGSELVTNYHVVRWAWTHGVRRVVVRSEGRSLNATITHVDVTVDLAVVEVDTVLPALEPSTSALREGQPVAVIGSPYGFGGSASTGIVSAIRSRYVQLSAPVSPGSSGGPVLDGEGRVVAVTERKVVVRGAEGLSFAIPIGTVCRLTAAC